MNYVKNYLNKLKQIIPEGIKQPLRRGRRFISAGIHKVQHDPSTDYGETVEETLAKSYQLKYGPRFNAALDNRDEMYKFIKTRKVGGNITGSQTHYFSSGEMAFTAFKDILGDQGISFTKIASLLEFACGYGRITRFLVTGIDSKNITVSDIDSSAVKFNAAKFGTRPLVSVSNPANFVCRNKFQVIFVASLFSHLNLAIWPLWLERLYKLLKPGGLLIFSTHGVEHNLPANSNELLVKDGFWFNPANETAGRLATEIYGTTWVSETWVRKCVQEYGMGSISAYYPKKLWMQDVYIIKQSSFAS